MLSSTDMAATRWRVPPQPVPHPAARAARAGLRFLVAAADAPQGLQSQISDAPGFDRPLSGAALRREVLERHGLDIGFDAGPENFTSMLALRLLAHRGAPPPLQRRLAATFETRHWQRRYRFFATAGGFAADTDCSGVALAALWAAGRLAPGDLLAGALQIAAAAAPATLPRPGVPMVYWDDSREPGVDRRGHKLDACAAANAVLPLLLALRLPGLAEARRRTLQAAADATLDWLAQALADPAGSRYYPSPDTLLCLVGELIAHAAAARLRLGVPLRRAVQARLAAPGTPLERAQRLLAAQACGLDGEPLAAALVAAQQADGGWPASRLFTLGRLPQFGFGSRALTTVFATAALAAMAP